MRIQFFHLLWKQKMSAVKAKKLLIHIVGNDDNEVQFFIISRL